MKTLSRVFLVLLIQIAIIPLPNEVSAQTNEATQMTEADHDALRALRVRIEKAFAAGDIEGVLAEAHDEVLFTTMNSDVARSKDDVRGYFDKMMGGPDPIVESISMTFEPDELTRFYGNTGINIGVSKGHYVLTSGLEFDVEARWTAVMAKEDGRWLVTAFHYSANMFENPILDNLQKTATWIAVAIGVAALLIGFLIGRRRRKS